MPSARADVNAVVQRPQLPARQFSQLNPGLTVFITNVNLNQTLRGGSSAGRWSFRRVAMRNGRWYDTSRNALPPGGFY